jgi:perosamine synthetase
MMAYLDDRQIDSRPFFPPLSSLPAYADRASSRGAAERNPVAYDLSTRAINLPSAMTLTEDQVDRVCTAVTAMLQATAQRRSA